MKCPVIDTNIILWYNKIVIKYAQYLHQPSEPYDKTVH